MEQGKSMCCTGGEKKDLAKREVVLAWSFLQVQATSAKAGHLLKVDEGWEDCDGENGDVGDVGSTF